MIRRWRNRLRILWLQKVRRRSGRFDPGNDRIFESVDLNDQAGPQRPA